MAMEFVRGETLEALVERVRALPVDRAVATRTGVKVDSPSG
jgi:hypothetical protein